MSEPPPDSPAPRHRSIACQILWFWLGLAIFAVIGVVGFFMTGLGGSTSTGLLAAFIILAVTAAPAVWALRVGRVALGSGIMGGYALATAFSTGQCTLWSAGANYAWATGFNFYFVALGGTLGLALIIAVGESIARRIKR